MSSKKPVQFGPDNAVIYKIFHDWSGEAIRRKLLILPVSSGLVAQHPKTGVTQGAWFYKPKDKGWFYPLPQKK